MNASLNESGQSQAKKAGNKLSQLAFETIYASSLIRTHETLAPLSRDFMSLEGFDEISWGDQEGVKASVEAQNKYASTIKSWREGDLHQNLGGGESPIQVMHRQREAMDVVMGDDAEKSLICMHGRAMRILLCWMLNYPLNYMDGFPHQNCCFYSLNFNGKSFSVRDFNEVGHLGS